MANQLGIELLARLNEAQSTTSIQSQIQRIQQQLDQTPLRINIDPQGSVKQFESQMNNVSRKMNKISQGSNKGMRVFDTRNLNEASTGLKGVVSSIDEAQSHLVGTGREAEVVNRRINGMTGEIDNFSLRVREGGEVVGNYRYMWGQAETGAQGYFLTTINETDKTIQKTNQLQQAETRRIQNLGQMMTQVPSEVMPQDAFDTQGIEQYIQSMDQFRNQSLAKTMRITPDFRNNMHNISAVFKDGEGTLTQYQMRLDQATQSLYQYNQQPRENISRDVQWFHQMKVALQRVPLWFAAMTAFWAPLRSAQQGMQGIMEIDTALTQLQRVTESSREEYERFLQVSGQLGSNLATESVEIIRATSEFARLGYELNEASALAQEAVLYSNVGMLDVDTATTDLISTIRGFGIEVDEQGRNVRRVVDVFNEVGNNFAITSAGIGEALRRSASSFHEAGNTMEESVAMISAANAVIQDESRVGNAFKTITMRIRGVNEETGELAEHAPELENMFNRAGISMMENEDTFRSTYDIMNDLAEVWDTLTDFERSEMLDAIAGRQHGNVIAAMLQNWEDAQNAVETSTHAMGSAARENEMVMDTMEAKMTQLSNNIQVFWSTVYDSDGAKMLIDGFNAIIRGLQSLASNFGFVVPAVTALTLALTILKQRGMFDIVAKTMAIGRAMRAKTQAVGGVSGAFSRLIIDMRLASNSMVGMLNRTMSLSTGMRGLAASLGAVTRAFLPAAIIGGATMALMRWRDSVNEARQAQEELRQEMEHADDMFSRNHDSIEELVDEYDRLRTLRESSDLNEEQEAEYLRINQELAEVLPRVVIGEDEKGNAIFASTEIMRDHIELMERRLELERQLTGETASGQLESARERMEEERRLAREIADEQEENIQRQIELEQGLAEGRFETQATTRYGLSEEMKARLELSNLQEDFLELQEKQQENLGNATEAQQEMLSIVQELTTEYSNLTSADLMELTNWARDVDVLDEFADRMDRVRDATGDALDADLIATFTNDIVTAMEESSERVMDNEESWNQQREALLEAGASQEQATEIINALTASVDENTGATDENTDAKWDNIDATEALFGITGDQISQMENAIETVMWLSQVENLNSQQKDQLSEAIAFLTSMFPHLDGAIVDNIGYLMTEVQALNKVNEASSKMAHALSVDQSEATKAVVEGVNNKIQAYQRELDAINTLAKERDNLYRQFREQGKQDGYLSQDMVHAMDSLDRHMEYRTLRLAEHRENMIVGIRDFNTFYEELTTPSRGSSSGGSSSGRSSSPSRSSGSSGSRGSGGSSGSTGTQEERDQLAILDAIIRQINQRERILSAQDEQLQRSIDLADHEGAYNRKLQLTGRQIDVNNERMDSLKQANEDIAEIMERTSRASGFGNTDSWFDDDNEKTIDFINRYNSASISQQERMMETFDTLQSLRNAYDGNRESIWDLESSIRGLDNAYREIQDTINQNRFENQQAQIERYQRSFDRINNSIAKNNLLMNDMEEGTAEYTHLLNLNNSELEYHNELLKQEAEEIDAILRSGNLTTEMAQFWNDALEENTQAQMRNKNAIRENTEQIDRQYSNLADDIIDIYKDMYREQQRETQRAIDDELRALEKAHEEKMKMLDDEMSAYEDAINERLKVMDEEESEEEFNRRLRKLQEEESSLRKRINALSLDDSAETNRRRAELEEDLASKTEDIERLKNDRTNSLRRDSLRDDLEAKREEIENEREASEYILEIKGERFEGGYEEAKKFIDMEKEYWDQHYENLLNDERRFAEIREDIMNGHFDEIKDDFSEFGLFLNDNLEDIGQSLTHNLIDKVEESLKSIKKLKDGTKDLSDIQSTVGDPSSGFQTDRIIDMMDRNAQEHRSTRSSSRKRELESENQMLGAIIGADFDEDNGTWYKDGKRLFHKGGIVGEKSSKIGEIVDRLFNTRPNEKVVKSLVGELQIPSDNITKNFIPNMRGLMSSVSGSMNGTPVSSTNHYDFDIYIDSIQGGREGAEDLFRHINKKIKTKGGMK